MDKQTKPNPSTFDLVIIGGVVVAGLVILGKISEAQGKVNTGSGVKMAPTRFNTIYRMGDTMQILWNFQHKGPAQDVILAFGVASHALFGFGGIPQPFQTLEKNVRLNADSNWTDYSIDHAGILSSLQSAGSYDAISYIRTPSGQVLDEQRYYASITAI